ncbi:MAG: hypothetical protein ABSE76_01455 [Minisyncoccia bacterium]|jgi:hypothetical protein
MGYIALLGLLVPMIGYLLYGLWGFAIGFFAQWFIIELLFEREAYLELSRKDNAPKVSFAWTLFGPPFFQLIALYGVYTYYGIFAVLAVVGLMYLTHLYVMS